MGWDISACNEVDFQENSMFRGFPSCKKNPRKLSVVDVRTGSYLAAKSAYAPWLMMSRQDRSGIPRGQILMMASHSLTHLLSQ